MSRLRIFIAVLVALVWAAYYVRAFTDSGFHPPAELSGLMLAVVTWLFGTEVRNALRRPKDKDDD